ncbi:MAG: hypothetical protein EHM47_04355, partial [Ignavibacteriales bacterium]
MKNLFLLYIIFLLISTVTISQEQPELKWSFNASLIEACSCPMFCQCYFNPEPAAHSGHSSHGEA